MNKKRKILIIGNYPPPFGGVPYHIEMLSQHLAKNDWDCTILSGGTSGIESKEKLLIIKPTYLQKLVAFFSGLLNASIIKYYLPFKIKGDNWRLFFRYIIYSQIAYRQMKNEKYTVVVSYNLLSYGPVGGYLSNVFKIPHILNIFGEIYKYNVVLDNAVFYSMIANTSKKLLSCSDHCGKSIKQINSIAVPETVIYGIDLDHFKPEDSPPHSFQKKYSLNLNEPIVLFVGRLSYEMGLNSFVELSKELWKTHPHVQFVAAGQKADSYELGQKHAAEYSKFKIHASIPYEDLCKFYQTSSVLAVPTHGLRTCSSLAAMEAMSTRKPVVAFATGGIPEILIHGSNGFLVEENDIQQMSKFIKSLLDDSHLYQSVATAALQYAREHFDINSVNVKMERHIIDVIEDAR